MVNIDHISSINGLCEYLYTVGCKECNLGYQENINGCVVYRGNPAAKKIIIGEAPGKDEDKKRQPFTGPAGQLMDKIFGCVGWDTNKDWYATNVVLCRPVAPCGCGKENITPVPEQQRKCKVYLDKTIQIIKPDLICLLGKVAAQSVLGTKESMKNLRGKAVFKDGIIHYIMYHPAAILHASSNPEEQQRLKELTWEDIKFLKKICELENI